MKIQSKYFIPVVVLAICFLTLIATSEVLADSQQTKSRDSFYTQLSERVEKGVRGSIRDWHYYWKDGFFRIDGQKENFKLPKRYR
jgi:hypothetical protein